MAILNLLLLGFLQDGGQMNPNKINLPKEKSISFEPSTDDNRRSPKKYSLLSEAIKLKKDFPLFIAALLFITYDLMCVSNSLQTDSEKNVFKQLTTSHNSKPPLVLYQSPSQL